MDQPAFTVTAKLGEHALTFQFSSLHYEDLECVLRTLFDVSVDEPMTTKYRDDEGDVITISTSQELADALSLSNNHLELCLITHAPPQADTLPEKHSVHPATEKFMDQVLDPMKTGVHAPGSSTVHARPTDFEIMRNEFHYHRLIVQTAIEDFFRQLRESLRSASPPHANEAAEAPAHSSSPVAGASANPSTISDAVSATFVQLGNQLSNLPSPSDIAAVIAAKLAELHAYTAPILDEIRRRIASALEQFYLSMATRPITYTEVQHAAQTSAEVIMKEIAQEETDAAAARQDTASPQEDHTPQPASSATSEFERVSQSGTSAQRTPILPSVSFVQSDPVDFSDDTMRTEVPTSTLIDTAPQSAVSSVNVNEFSTPRRAFDSPDLNTLVPASDPAPTMSVSAPPPSRPLVVEHDHDFELIETTDANPNADVEQSDLLSSLVMPVMSASTVAATQPWLEHIARIRDMGFSATEEDLVRLLVAYDGNVASVVEQLSNIQT